MAALTFEALSGANVGTWELNVADDTVHCCEVTAKLFGIPEESGQGGLPLRHFERCIHPDDLQRFQKLLELSCHTGGLFVAEYRTVPRPGETRWILGRGSFDLDASGIALHGRGIVIDITDAKGHETADAGSLFLNRPSPATPPIHGVAEHVLEAWEVAQRLEPEEFARLKPRFESLLFEVGRALAADLSADVAACVSAKMDLH